MHDQIGFAGLYTLPVTHNLTRRGRGVGVRVTCNMEQKLCRYGIVRRRLLLFKQR